MKNKPVTLNFGFGTRGEFDFDVVKCDAEGNQIPGTMRRLVNACPNLITNNGLSLLNAGGRADGQNVDGTIASFMAACGVGSGTTTPAFTDTALTTRIAVQNATTSAEPVWNGASIDTAYYTRTYTFGVGAAAGNISEIGLFVNNAAVQANSLLTTRALILVGGIPGSITVLSDEQLIVTYRLYVTAVIADSVLVTTQKGVEYTLTLRMSNMGIALSDNNASLHGFPIGPMMNGGSSGSGSDSGEVYYGATVTLGAATVGASATSTLNANGSTLTLAYGYSYLTVNSYRDDTITLVLASNYNVANAGAWRFKGNPFFIKIGVSPKVTKTSLDKIVFTIRTTVTRT